MARKGMVENNDYRKDLVKKYAKKRKLLKKEIKNREIPLEERFFQIVKLAQLPRNSSRVRVRSRCILNRAS